MAVGQLVSHLIKRDLLPLAGNVVLDVAGADLVKVRLAQVVQQAADGVALGAFTIGEKMLHHRIIDVDAVHDQAALARAVKAGGRGRSEKIRRFQPVQQAVSAGAGDVFVVDLHKFGVIVLHTNLTAPCRPESGPPWCACPRCRSAPEYGPTVWTCRGQCGQ